ncbi:MAG: hypothetical protein AABY22_12705 [Nanoarchaeota archaeon]
MSLHIPNNELSSKLKCMGCGKSGRNIYIKGRHKGYCHVCYKKLFWKPKLIKCPRCERMLPMHARGFCAGCYNSTYHIDKVKLLNAKRRHNIEAEVYKELTKECIVCGFDKLVDLHHLDHNNQNNSSDNLVGLCPNHHKMLHSKKYQQEIFSTLKEKGFKIPENGYKTDGFIKIPRKVVL